MIFFSGRHKGRKKAWIYSVAIALFTLLTFISLTVIFLGNQDKLGGQDRLGEKQFDILSVAKRAEKAMLYIDKSAELVTDSAIFNMADKGGFSGLPECGAYMGYSLWSTKDQECFPMDTTRGLADEISKGLLNMTVLYATDMLPTGFSVNVIEGIEVQGISNGLLYLSETPIVGGVGSPFDEGDAGRKIERCTTGRCVAQIAEKYAGLYSSLPYVYGGESPYSYEDTIGFQKLEPDGLFKGVVVERYQPAGNGKHTGKPYMPGFDCSGFVWWVFKHAGMLEHRTTAAGYYEYAKKNWGLVCEGIGCHEDIEDIAEPGDVMFIHPCEERGVCHIGIYVGSNRIVESTGTEGIVDREFPKKYYPDGSVGIKAVYRPRFNLGSRGATTGVTTEGAEGAEGTATGSAGGTADQSSGGEQAAKEGQTGAFDRPTDGDATIYSFTPSFSVHRDYDISIYDSLRQESRWLIEKVSECENNPDRKASDTLYNCVKKYVNQTSFSMECNTSAKKDMFYGFAEMFLRCVEQDVPAKDACACEITPEFNERFKGMGMTVVLNNTGSSVVLSARGEGIDGTLNYVIANRTLAGARYIGGLLHMMPIESVVVEFEFDSDSLDELEVNKESSGAELYLYKRGEEIALMQKYDHDRSSVPDCVLSPMRTFRFCASSKEELMVFDELSGSFEIMQPVYRFALAFTDNIPPPVIKGLVAEDMKLSETELLLSFRRPQLNSKPVTDIDHYNIYCSETEFSETTAMTPSRKVNSGDIEEPGNVVDATDLINVLLDSCNNEKLVDKKTYYLSVAAVDRSDNEIRRGILAIPAIPYDDLPPGIATMTSSGIGIDTDGNTIVSLSWAEADKNYDLSEITDLAGYDIYLEGSRVGGVSSEELSAEINIGKQPEGYSPGAIVVLGVDDDGNVIDDPAITYEEAYDSLYRTSKII
ncbi:C40 family peptidase [Candidatus Woesearchaeota archaeon]|nr:C40 family peptidase [Candidatus Woesearchaeota archaeon]